MDDQEIDDRLRAHFTFAAQAQPVPDFDTLLDVAQPQAHAPQSRRWATLAAGALAASLVVAIILERRATSTGAADALLLAQLTQSTRWTAPSDRWLAATPTNDYLGLPRFNDMIFQMEEVKPWF